MEAQAIWFSFFPTPHKILKATLLIFLMIDPDHLPLALSLTIYKIADIKIPILINLYPNPIPLIQHQLTLVYLSLRADDDSLAVSLAVDYGADVELVLVDGYPRAAEVFQVGKGSRVEGQGLETYEVL